MKVVINRKFGGFHLSEEAEALAIEKGLTRTLLRKLYRGPTVRARANPALVKAVEQLGSLRASGEHADLRLVDVPAHMIDRSQIHEYDGMEWVAENHQTWGSGL